jgi:hypothetical protein
MGLVDGGSNIREMSWKDIQDIMQKGGTVINSARCQEFREKKGRRQAALHLAQLGVNRLVVIGGDGSLTGANLFKIEWPSLLSELVERGELPQAQADKVGGTLSRRPCRLWISPTCAHPLDRPKLTLCLSRNRVLRLFRAPRPRRLPTSASLGWLARSITTCAGSQ